MAAASSDSPRPSEALWCEISKGPDVEPSDVDAMVLPVFPSSAVLWPASTVRVGVMEPAHVKMYHDMIMSGSRYVVAPLARLGARPQCGPDAPPESMPQTCWLQRSAAVLRLEELEDHRHKDGMINYVAKHVVNMRASIRRVLNPSSLFVDSPDEKRSDYLRVEVQLLPGSFDTSSINNTLEEDAMEDEETLAELCVGLESLRRLSLELEEPCIPQVSMDGVKQLSSWQLAELWYQTRLRVLEHREKQRVKLAVNEWLQEQKEAGRVFDDPSSAIEAMPERVQQDLWRANQAEGRIAPAVADRDFYEPFLRLMAAVSGKERAALLTTLVGTELKRTQARASIRRVLS